jgi:hypothetical protein
MQGFIITWCGYEGVEVIVGLFTEEEAVERMTRFRKAEFKTTHYIPRPEDWNVGTKTEEDYENEPHYQTMDKWTEEDRLQERLDRSLDRDRHEITPEDFPNMSTEEFEHQVYLRSKEFKLKQMVNRFCVMEIDATGAECACTKLGVPADEYVLY